MRRKGLLLALLAVFALSSVLGGTVFEQLKTRETPVVAETPTSTEDSAVAEAPEEPATIEEKPAAIEKLHIVISRLEDVAEAEEVPVEEAEVSAGPQIAIPLTGGVIKLDELQATLDEAKPVRVLATAQNIVNATLFAVVLAGIFLLVARVACRI